MTNGNDPLISIITPTYNREEFIENTILSVVGQNYRCIEYIIIDGNSDDNTVELLDRYKSQDSRISYVSESDNGMYDAINKGFTLATGEILAYINSDDMYAPEVFKMVVDYFQKHPEVDVVYGDTLVLEGSIKDIHMNLYMPNPELWLRAGGIITQPTVFMRRHCWDKVGHLGQDVKYLGDCEYWLRLINNGFRFGKINEVLAVELDHGDMLRNTMQEEIENEKRYLKTKYWPEFPVNRLIREVVLFSRRVFTPLLHMVLILKINMRLCNGSWGNFIVNYQPKANLVYYLLNKIFKSNYTVWTVTTPVKK